MLKRTITGIVLIAVVAGFMLCGYFVSSIFIDILILLFLAGAVYEMIKCFKLAGYNMFVLPSVIVLVGAYPVFYLMQHFMGSGTNVASAGLQGLFIVFLVAAMAVLTIFTFKPAKYASKESQDCQGSDLPADSKNACGFNDLLANMFIIVYPMLFMSAAWIISYKYCALFAILYAIFVPVLGGDGFAYWFGSMIGGKKLCPGISPKKTIAGGIGALFGAMLMSIVFWVIFEYFSLVPGYISFISHDISGWAWKSALIYLAIGVVCGAIGELGDLAASRIKRAMGIKDYGKIFPGHGGFMDRIDSVMYCLVVLLVAFSCIYGY